MVKVDFLSLANTELSIPSNEINGMIERSIGAKYSGIFKKKKGNVFKDSHEVQSQTYYMKNLEYHLKFDTASAHSKKAQKHLVETFASMKYIQTIRKPSDETVYKSKFQCAQLSNTSSVSANRSLS